MFKKLWKPRRALTGGPSVKVYQRYRTDGVTLNHKIMDATLSKAAIQYGSRALGLEGRGRELILDSEDDLSVLMDYALYEYRAKGKNAVERYQEEIGGETQIERELLAAMVTSSTSLFEVESVSTSTCTMRLNDLVNEGCTINLMDINFSQRVTPDWLLFIRPITLENFSMTSGIAFIFPRHLQDELLKRWHRSRSRRKRSAQSVSARRYVAFFRLSKTKGIEVRYEEMGNV